jgi:glycine C-acetyltransferase
LLEDLKTRLADIEADGLYKRERLIEGAQGGKIRVAGREMVNLCANNYLGLADHPQVVAAAREALETYGFGMASVRFICGAQDQHRALEREIAAHLDQDDAILFAACFDANGGVFEPLLDEKDAIISDALNHASIIDGIRLCKARRLRYANCDMAELEARLVEAQDARTRMIVTDGVFSMDGTIAPLAAICALAERYGALVVVDDSHATGFIGAGGRGTPALAGVAERVDILTGTLGKALGGASGGYVSARRPVIEWLRQRSRPYLFSNSIPPVVAAGALAALDLIQGSESLRAQLADNARYFRGAMTAAGFTLKPGEHPIIPVMIGDGAKATRMADRLLELGLYVVGFSYPVVAHGQARIRTQMSAAHSRSDLERAVAAFSQAGRELGLI